MMAAVTFVMQGRSGVTHLRFLAACFLHKRSASLCVCLAKCVPGSCSAVSPGTPLGSVAAPATALRRPTLQLHPGSTVSRKNQVAAIWEKTSRSRERNSRAMPSNVEIKARVKDAAQFAEKAAALSQSEGTIIRQHDTFFNCSNGRLKLRDFMNESGQLIFYERPDNDGPKLSRYSISPTSDPSSLRAVLSDALGIKGEVRKERRLFLIGQTRIHLDSVEGLGDYMELEVVMRPEQTVQEGQRVAEDLMEKLAISKESLVTGAYMDLILKGHKEA